MPRVSLTTLLLVGIVTCSDAGQGRGPIRTPDPSTPAREIEPLLEVLARTPFGPVYADDGAGDGTVTQSGEIIGSGPTVRPVSAVKAIVDLRGVAIPLLIDHLDDSRPTAITFESRRVPLGHVALDILMHITRSTKRIFFSDCGDDGLGACVQPGYYFRPDATRAEMRAVKARWDTARKRGWVRFEYPSWWAK